MYMRKTALLILNNIYIFAKFAKNVFIFNQVKCLFFKLKYLSNKIRLLIAC